MIPHVKNRYQCEISYVHIVTAHYVLFISGNRATRDGLFLLTPQTVRSGSLVRQHPTHLPLSSSPTSRLISPPLESAPRLHGRRLSAASFSWDLDSRLAHAFSRVLERHHRRAKLERAGRGFETETRQRGRQAERLSPVPDKSKNR